MHGLRTEHRRLNGHALSWDLAQHLHQQGPQGKVAIVTERPVELLSATKKQWLKIMRQVQRKRSSTIDVERVIEFSNQIGWMQGLTFSARLPNDFLDADVTFATADDFVRTPPAASLHISHTISKKKNFICSLVGCHLTE